MGFSIGGLFKKATGFLGKVGPILSAIPTPFTRAAGVAATGAGIVGGALSSSRGPQSFAAAREGEVMGFNPRAPSTMAAVASSGGGGSFLSTLGSAITPFLNPAITGAGPLAIPGLTTTGGGVIKPILDKVRAQTGRRVSARRLRAFFREVGIGAAGALGLTPAEAATLVLSARGRRGRGISARDIRTTKRVINFAVRLNQQLGLRRRSAARAAPPIRRRRATK